MKYDDETLMAFADGELDETLRAEIAAAVERDPELAQRVAGHRALRSRVAGTFGALLDEPAPDRLVNAARGARTPAANTRRAGDVVQFPVRGSRVSPMSPEQRERARTRYNRWQELSPEQRELARERWHRFRELPPEQQQRVRDGYRNYKKLTPEQRQHLRERWKNATPEERQRWLERRRARRPQ